jgi:hypothetical protein
MRRKRYKLELIERVPWRIVSGFNPAAGELNGACAVVSIGVATMGNKRGTICDARGS